MRSVHRSDLSGIVVVKLYSPAVLVAQSTVSRHKGLHYS